MKECENAKKNEPSLTSMIILHNTLCDIRLQNCTAAKSPDFTITELKAALGELKGGKCADSGTSPIYA